MGIILWIIFGALVGWISSLIMQTGGGLVWDIVVGIVGAILGGLIMNFFGQGGVGGFDIYSLLVAILGACVLIVIAGVLRRK